jgi:predicted transcriptional regulator YdeE
MLNRIVALVTLGVGFIMPQAYVTRESLVKSRQEESFYVAGYSLRTNNAKEMSGQGEIGKLWQRFMQENLGAAIPGRADATLMVVYSEYASDEKGDYTYTLGARVPSVDHLPVGMSYRKIVPGSYAVFTTEQGPVTQIVPAEWQKIWGMTPEQMGGKRAFVTDYEVYDQRSANPQNAQVEIHIGLQPLKL